MVLWFKKRKRDFCIFSLFFLIGLPFGGCQSEGQVSIEQKKYKKGRKPQGSSLSREEEKDNLLLKKLQKYIDEEKTEENLKKKDKPNQKLKETLDLSQYKIRRIPLKSRRFKGCFTTNFHLAAGNGKIEEVRRFLAAGANPFIYDFLPNGIRALPIHYAALKGHIEVVKLFLKSGVPLLARSMNGSTLLHFAVSGKRKKMVEFLLKKGIPPNIRGGSIKVSPLSFAVEVNALEIAKVLLRHGANPNFQDVQGRSPLHKAVYLGYIPFIKLLLAKGAKINIKTSIHHYSPIHYAIRSRRHSSSQVLLLLLKHGANPNSQAKDGETPLHIAIRKQKWNLAKILLHYGANPNLALVSTGETGLHLLAALPSPPLEMAKLMLSKGGNPLLKTKKGKTAMDISIENTNASLAQLFEEAKSSSSKNNK